MHKKIIEEATLEQLKDFSCYALDEIKKYNEDLYDNLEIHLYKKIYGYHFNHWLLEKALSKLKNEDGSIGNHWKLNETSMLARSNGIDFKEFNEYDWCYVMNMIYSDFYGSVPNETNIYVKMSKKFLEDKDSEDGKALRYYFAMKD